MGGIHFVPDRDIPDLSGKVILVTGGNSGLGKESILQLAKHNPDNIFMGARSEAKAKEAIGEIKKAVPDAKIQFLPLDLSSFASVRDAANQVLRSSKRLDILMNNAGIMATPAAITKDGYEIQFGTNHMGHALLTKQLLPLLEKTAAAPDSDVRIINLSSSYHAYAPNEGLLLSEVKSPMASFSTWVRYGQSKLVNIYYTQQLAKRYPSIKSVAVHPGIVNTNLMSGPKQSFKIISPFLFLVSRFFTSVKDGALNQLWAATAKSRDVNQAGFYYPVGVEFSAKPVVTNAEVSDALWEFTEKELKEHGY
ncbi:related to retinol dehydrogenase 12 [Fusarium torulosum]|uniref:Related to retinol dehydrogenase 12 n=1 Tax=Fusarium torulosum TaxID=33205 RepID=A0AAE8MN00_9HYPO|nr:related to retinol dehydrogenase 12 [Fusarium torulosum]